MVKAGNHEFHVVQTVFLILNLAISVVIIENIVLLNPSQRNIAVNKLYKLSYKTEI
jgi:hypothetical protein